MKKIKVDKILILSCLKNLKIINKIVFIIKSSYFTYFIKILPDKDIMLSEDQKRLILSITLLIPLSFFIRFIKPAPYRYIYSLMLSILLQLYVFESNMIGIYVQALIVFILIKVFKGKKIGAIVTI